MTPSIVNIAYFMLGKSLANPSGSLISLKGSRPTARSIARFSHFVTNGKFDLVYLVYAEVSPEEYCCVYNFSDVRIIAPAEG